MLSHVTCVNFAELSTTEMATGEPRAVGRALNSQRLFSWGANSYGQLGLGHCTDKSIPEEINLSEDFGNVSSVSGGGGHTLVLTDNGKLFVCGSNDKGQLGLGSTEDQTVLTPVGSIEREIITKVVGGWDFTIMLNDKGIIYVTGSNKFNQLGLPDITEKYITTPVRMFLPGNPKVTEIEAGLRHGIALTDTGQVYIWGSRKSSKDKIGAVPTIVHLPEGTKGMVIKITAGSYFFSALTDHGEIISWGDNTYGQLSTDKVIQQPYLVPTTFFKGKVTDIQAGWTHMLALTDQKKIYSWGRGNYGQLGRAVDLDLSPQVIGCHDNIKCVRCGSEHNLALTDKGRLLTWGWNEHGLCGNGNEDNVMTPSLVDKLNGHMIKTIGCGAGHSFVLVYPT
ncbi:secretion-regulating guanine nucleotide exchange factor-like isoform X1 [Mytilus galloprovincialis]|uniref:secretion-regulating guanine nucleotide exchange factor-like isoform X1 n=1 Tax=Mytilus galloprovincialis TaxID=29158 RepID=UPI003F7B8A8C